MKNILFVIAFGLSGTFGFSELSAQEIEQIIPKHTIDSLQHLIEAHPKADQEKVRLLNKYARLSFYNQEYLKGFIATRDARELSKKINFKGGEIMYYLTLAAFHGGKDWYSYQLQQALNIVQKDSTLSEYFIKINIPDGYPPNTDQHLLDKLKPILQYFEELDDKEIQLAIGNLIGWCYLNLGNINEVKILVDKGIQLSIDLNQNYRLYEMYLAKIKLASLEEKNEINKILNELIEILSKNNNKNSQGLINLTLGKKYRNTGQNALAVDYYLKSSEAFESIGDLNILGIIYFRLGNIYQTLEMNAKALEMYEKRISVSKKLNDNIVLSDAYRNHVSPLYKLKRYDEARKYMALALQSSKGQRILLTQAESNILEGKILMDEEKYSNAIPYFQKGYEAYLKLDNHSTQWSIYSPLILMAECYMRIDDPKNALKYALESYKKEYENFETRAGIKGRINFLISEIYIELGQHRKAFDYLKAYQELTGDANKTKNANKVAAAEIRSVIDKNETQIELLEKEKIEKEQKAKIQRVWIFSMSGAFISTIIIIVILYRNNRNKQKSKRKIEKAYDKLKSTQSQLIQSEKMASLGELTAGIAHEIQNPLNFVNNFSEVSEELLEELTEEIEDNSKEDIKDTISNLKQNLGKINHHGKRASDIVKSMLQHSRTSSGKKELIDINLLADEYLRLSYHGLRAKDRTFNADFKMDFDESIPKTHIVPQDFGRVILNLINNAFYAVSQKDKSAKEDYNPTVSVRTKKSKDKIEISIKDNGNGIPKDIVDKIFQPFFTTKPTGEGTGLGLSLAYDIITKGHGGTLTVASKKGIYTEFKIILPIKKID